MQLPAFPATNDVWQTLKNEKPPLVIYGMGNGADKLLSRFEEFGISYADFFASDGFVRGHSFHGKRVLSFSEIKEKYRDFQIVLSFATNREEVLKQLFTMHKEYGLLMPDLPVVGSDTFTAEFYNRHFSEIEAVDRLLSDEESRELYREILHYKLTGNISFLRRAHAVRDTYAFVAPERIKVAVDCGAYNGDTAKELLSVAPHVTKIIAVEPDPKNFKKLVKTVEREALSATVTPVHAAVSDTVGETLFSSGGNRNSSLSNPSYETKSESVPTVTVDSLTDGVTVDYIKYDVEGEELSALLGSLETIKRSRPLLRVSAYHRNEDVFRLPLFLAEHLTEYRFYYRRTPSLPAWEIHLIAVPIEKEGKPQ